MGKWPSFVGAWLCLTALPSVAQPQPHCCKSDYPTVEDRLTRIALSLVANVSSGSSLRKPDDELKSPDPRVRRRALWQMVQGDYSADDVNDRIMEADDQLISPIPFTPIYRSVGKQGFPRLYYHLRKAEMGYARYKISATIILLGEPDAGGRRALEELTNQQFVDADLGYLLDVLRAGTAPRDEAEKLMRNVWQRKVCPSMMAAGDGPFWPFLAYESTRERALVESRNRLQEGLALHARGGDPNANYTVACLDPLFGLITAASFRTLTAADIGLLNDPATGSSDMSWSDEEPLPLLLARWQAGGRADRRKLDEFLRVAGMPRPYQATINYLLYVTERLLSADDVAAFVARANDPNCPEDIRRGTMRLLTLTGTIGGGGRELIIRLSKSESESLSCEAAMAIGGILENRADTQDVVRAVQARAQDEARPSVRKALDYSYEILVGGVTGPPPDPPAYNDR